MTDETTIQEAETQGTEEATPPQGLYIFYDANKDIQVGVSGDYTIGEAILMLGAARGKLELLQYHAIVTQRETKEPSRIVVPS